MRGHLLSQRSVSLEDSQWSRIINRPYNEDDTQDGKAPDEVTSGVVFHLVG